MKTHTLETAEANIVYDVQGLLPTADGRPPLVMIGQPMDASGFRSHLDAGASTLVASHLPFACLSRRTTPFGVGLGRASRRIRVIRTR